MLAKIIEREQPDAVLPTLGGQTGLNIAMALYEQGLIGVPGTPEMIGANADAIATAEDRERFKEAMIEIGLDVPRSGIAHTVAEARTIAADIGLPVIIRPAYILGGRGTGIAATVEHLERLAADGIAASPIGEILVEESIAGWKEFELEVMRDRADNCVIICSIENVDPMGVHTGDSITVAPAQTLTDVEYQEMRDAVFAVIRRVGVETGGSNVQFALDPETGRMVVIEMNPRVSRSSALASKATGFPIAKIAARLAVGYTLDEIPNDVLYAAAEAPGGAGVPNRASMSELRDQGIWRQPASFEPVIDYVVTKIPRWAFEKLPGTSGILGTQMQSVGEAMAIGRTFPESLQKALRSLEQGRFGLNADPVETQLTRRSDDDLLAAVGVPTPERMFQVGELLRRAVAGGDEAATDMIERVHDACRIDRWFLDQMLAIVEERHALEDLGPDALDALDARAWRRAKRLGFADAQLAHLWGTDELTVRAAREAAGVHPTYKTVDTCAAEFAAETPYHYSTWEDEDEVRPSDRPRVVILGSGPNRIGQGIEFDYCCVHASFALRDAGFETVMLNCNPETVSTDYDTSDRLYFEPLTPEDVHHVIAAETAAAGGTAPKVIVSLGGQTPLKLASVIPAELIAGTVAGLDRPRRGPREVERPVRRAAHPAAAGRHRDRHRGSARRRRARRVPGPRASLLRARWAGDADRARRQPARRGDGRAGRLRLARPGGRAVRRATRAHRPLPRRRHRGRRRRRARPHRRGAHRRCAWSTSRRRACTPATRRARSRRRRCRHGSSRSSRRTRRRSPSASTCAA